jgi:glycosyltransferase involved in cell wall biosynthesis
MRVTLFIPTLNEIDGVKAIMPRIKREWVDEIIMVDGHSSDGTKEWLVEHGYNVIDQKEPGTINAWWQGFAAASGDVIIPFSPDGNSDPEGIPKLVEKMKEGYGMVTASRYLGEAESKDDSWLSGLANKFFTKLINALFGANYSDTLVMYRAFKKELLEELGFNKKREPLFEILIAIRAARRRLRVAEVPASEPPRVDGDDSRAHPGLRNRVKNGLLMLHLVFREFLFFH